MIGKGENGYAVSLRKRVASLTWDTKLTTS